MIKPAVSSIISVASLSLLACSLVACKTGFSIPDEEDTDTIYRGPTEGASWRLVLDEDGESFRLQKRSSASSDSNEYSMRGTYTTLDTGFTEFNISAGRDSEVSTSDLPALKIGDDSFVFFPFLDDENDLLAVIPTDTCPATDVRGNSLFLDSGANPSDASLFWLSSFRYDVSQNQAQYSDGIALDDDFTSPLANDFTGGSCLDGASESDQGDHYLSTRSAIIEIENQFTGDAYVRTFTTRSRVISDILDLDSENYIGFVHEQGQPEQSFYVSASCDDGICVLFREEDYDELDKDSSAYEIEFDQENLNYQSINGAAIGSILNPLNELTGNIACNLNSNVGSTSTKLIMCNAQTPDDNSKLITVILIDPAS